MHQVNRIIKAFRTHMSMKSVRKNEKLFFYLVESIKVEKNKK